MDKFPWLVFEEHMMNFLYSLLYSQPKPLLTQMERGRIDGWSQDEVLQVATRLNIS